jgi:hypothetical protein
MFEPCEGRAPFEPNDFSTPGEGIRLLPCPSRLPHDLEVGQKLARWFGHPYNSWYMGKIAEVNKRRTKSENVSVEFTHETEGETRGIFVAERETYGASRLWVLMEQIPIDVEDEESTSSSPPEDDEED